MQNKHSGFTLTELMVSMLLMGLILTTAIGIIVRLTGTQAKQRAQNIFYTEAVQLHKSIRELTSEMVLDYQAYFVSNGPDISACPLFDSRQIPANAATENTPTNRASLKYTDLFSWRIQGSNTEQILGGRTPSGAVDPCVLVVPEHPDTVQLIHPMTQKQLKIQHNADDATLLFMKNTENEWRVLPLEHATVSSALFEAWPAADPYMSFAGDSPNNLPTVRYIITLQHKNSDETMLLQGIW